jgi:hypothetical protein
MWTTDSIYYWNAVSFTTIIRWETTQLNPTNYYYAIPTLTLSNFPNTKVTIKKNSLSNCEANTLNNRRFTNFQLIISHQECLKSGTITLRVHHHTQLFKYISTEPEQFLNTLQHVRPTCQNCHNNNWQNNQFSLYEALRWKETTVL